MATVNICFSDNQDGTTAVLANWLKQSGDMVAAHEPIAEVETDKVVVEISSPTAGRIGDTLKQPGDTLEPGDILGFIETQVGESEETEKAQDVPPAITVNGNGASQRDRPRLSPAVRRLLKENQLDTSELTGSGRAGRITAKDINAYLQSHEDQPTPVQPMTSDDSLAGVRSHKVAVDPMRKSIAAHMVQSLMHTAPHVTTVFEADLSKVIAHRAQHKQGFQNRGVNLTLSTYFVSAAVQAIKKVPAVNSRFRDDHIEIYDDINIGMATALGDKGLVVPVLRHAQSKNLFGMAKELQLITNKARDRQITTADMQGGTFTISNHGVSGSLMASPIIINQPQSAILGIGKLEKRVVVKKVDGSDAIMVRPMCYITLTLDHRVLDAYQANSFLSELVSTLETWSD